MPSTPWIPVGPDSEDAPTPWTTRILPGPGWGRVYAWGLVVVALVIGVLFILNIAVPIGDSIARAAATGGMLLAGWGIGLLVPFSFTVRALRPAGAVAVLAVPLGVLLTVADIWQVGPERLGSIAGALLILLLFAFMACIPWHRLSQRQDLVPASISFVAIAAGGLVLSLSIAGLDLGERAVESVWRCGLGFVFAALVLLVPVRPRRLPTWLGWGALAQFAVIQALDPWVAGARSDRLLAAGFVLLAVLAITALTLQLLAPKPRPT